MMKVKKFKPKSDIKKSQTKRKKLKILFVTSESVPFAKTGGLADVSLALPAQLIKQGLDVRVILPKYKNIDEKRIKLEYVACNIPVKISDRTENMDILSSTINHTKYYLIKKDKYYDREELYQTKEGDYPDNCERFTYFSRAVLEALKAIDFKPDIIHCNDWQTGLIPVYLKTLYKTDHFFNNIKSVFTIHNIAYQGLFWYLDMHLTGLDQALFTYDKLEFYGKLNYLKAGIVFADKITTVSQKYIEEIKTPELGYGLHNTIKYRANDLTGIINGADYNIWDPPKDGYIAKNYTIKSVTQGKKACKKDLQIVADLSLNEDIPLIGMISRLAEHKGFDILSEVIDEIMNLGVEFVLLGTGEQKYYDLFTRVKSKHPDYCSINFIFNDELAHKIEAGADIYLMPSRYEPCGLNQLYSMRYGTIPVVRATGGLADTVKPVDIKTGEGTGFVFTEYSKEALFKTIKEAVELYRNDKKFWLKLQQNAMRENFSWEVSAKKYIELYRSLIQ
ncbi:MAG: glycogen synthase GlgA [Candidatus Hydrogenedentota bacterium]